MYGRQEGDGDFGKAVLGDFEDLFGEAGNREPDRDTHGRCKRELQEGLAEQEPSAQDCSHGGTVQHERGGVVDQTLTFQDRDEPAWNM